MNMIFSALLAPTPIECAASHHVGWHGKDQPCQGRGLFVGWCSSSQFFWSWLWCRWQLFCKAWIWTKHSFRKSRNLSLLWCLAWAVVTECDTWEGCCCFLPFFFADLAQWGWQQQPRSEQFCVDSRQFLHSLAWQSLMVPSNSMLQE